MASEEIQFLRDQVERLNAVLAEYQQKYPKDDIITFNSFKTTEDASKPWLTDRTLIAPLMTEYDTNLKSLNEQTDYYKREHRELRSQVDKLVAENSRLSRELKEAVQSQLETLDTEVLMPDIGDEQLLKNLQSQLQAALQEKDSAMEMWHASAQEVERLEAHLSTSHSNPRLTVMENQVHQIKDQYAKTISELNKEITSLNEELSHKKSELQASNIQVNELRTTLDGMKSTIRRQEFEKSHVVGNKEKSENMASNLHKKVTELESSMHENERKFVNVRRDKSELEDKLLEMQKRCKENEQKAYEAMLQVRDSIQMVENAKLEKDQAVQQAMQGDEEITRLTTSLNKVFDEAGARTREEVDTVRKQCNQNLAKLMEEIHSLEMENTEKQAQIERAIREKRAVETELEKIYQEGKIQGSKESFSIDELTRRKCEAEKQRDEAVIKLDSIEQQNKRLEMTYKQENSHLKVKNDQLVDRLTQMNQEFELSTDERVRLVENIDELKKKAHALQMENGAANRNKTKEITIMEEDLRRKEQDYSVKLQTLEDSHRHTMMDLRQMLASQQRMGTKWKEECNTITKKFEGKLTDMRAELSREKKRCGELSKLLKESSNKTAETQHMLSEYTHNIQRMEQRVRDAEQRAADSGNIMSRQTRKDNNIIEERRQLQRELERTLQDSKRRSGSSAPEPLALSDLGGNP